MKIVPLHFVLLTLFFTTANAQWVKTNGPGGITIQKLFDAGTALFAGTEKHGIYKSLDHGLSWVSSNSAETEYLRAECFAKDSMYLYVGIFGKGVYRSPDNGNTWQAANLGIETKAVNCLIVAGSFLMAGTIATGIYRSADHGDTWESANGVTLPNSSAYAMVYAGHRVTVATSNYLFYSNNYGNNWYVQQGNTAFSSIDNFINHGDTIVASAGSSIFRSEDGGATWGSRIVVNDAIFGFDNVGDTIYAGYQYGVKYSTDRGQTWTNIPSPDLRWGHRFNNDFKISGNNFVMAFQEIGAYVSQNKGATWMQAPLADFTPASTIDDAMICDNNVVYTGTHSDGIYKTIDQGDNWIKIGTPNNTDSLSNELVYSLLRIGPNIMLAGNCGNGLYRSTDNGTTWTHILAGLPVRTVGNLMCIETLAMCGPNVLAALAAEGVYYSSDSGLTWHATNLVKPAITSAQGFAVHGNVACTGVSAAPGSGVYRSTDYGVSWSITYPLLDIMHLASGDNNRMYAGSFSSVYVSNDDGQNWGNVGSGLPGTTGGGAFTILAWDNYVFVGNAFGVYFSANYGGYFTEVNDGMDPYPNRAVQGLTHDDVYLYAGTSGNAVWKRPLADFGVSLPVKMSPLTARYSKETAQLEWSTYSEVNTRLFEIERSASANSFEKISSVAANGHSQSATEYRYDDKTVMPGTNYYRLKIIDRDGKYSYSNIVSIEATKKPFMVLQPPANPFADQIKVTVSSVSEGKVTMTLLDNSGRIMKNKTAYIQPGVSTISLNGVADLAAGVYYCKVSFGAEVSMYKLLKQK